MWDDPTTMCSGQEVVSQIGSFTEFTAQARKGPSFQVKETFVIPKPDAQRAKYTHQSQFLLLPLIKH